MAFVQKRVWLETVGKRRMMAVERSRQVQKRDLRESLR